MKIEGKGRSPVEAGKNVRMEQLEVEKEDQAETSQVVMKEAEEEKVDQVDARKKARMKRAALFQTHNNPLPRVEKGLGLGNLKPKARCRSPRFTKKSGLLPDTRGDLNGSVN